MSVCPSVCVLTSYVCTYWQEDFDEVQQRGYAIKDDLEAELSSTAASNIPKR
jgi:hypothetical protein